MFRIAIAVTALTLLAPAAARAQVPLRSDAKEKAADPVMGSAAGWTVRMDIDGYFPDEGVLVSTTSPDFWKQGPGAFITKPPYLNGHQRQKYHRVYIFPTGEDWTQHKVTVVPDASGKLTLTCYAVAPGAMHIVHWDDIRIEGAKLDNGGFEKLDDEATPAGWKLGGWKTRAPKGRLVTDADDAAEGKRYVMSSWSWHWSATISDVVKDRPIVLRWKNRFVTPETRYPVRVGLNGLHLTDPEKHTKFEIASGMKTDAESGERYVGRLLDGFGIARYGPSKAVNAALGVYLAEASRKWRTRTIRLKPESDGQIELTFHAARVRDRDKGVYDPVYVDYRIVGVEGATLANADLRNVDEAGCPAGWRRIGLDRDFRIVREEDGKALARTWHQAGLRQTLTDVLAGREIRIRLEVRTPEAASDK